MPSAGSTSGSAMSGSFMTKIDPHQMLASELIGTKVISANNESIGDINDVIVDRNGQAVAAVVGVGGFLGIGEKDVAVPFKSLEFATREQVKAMNTNKTVSTTGSTTGTTTTGTTATTGTMGNTAVNAPATSSSSASSMDNGEPERVILRMTKAELQAAPAFDTDRDSTTTTGTTGTMRPQGLQPRPHRRRSRKAISHQRRRANIVSRAFARFAAPGTRKALGRCQGTDGQASGGRCDRHQ